MKTFDSNENGHKKSSFYPFMKRTLDVVVSSVALLVLSPIFPIVYLINLFCKSNRGPLFYKQERVGLHGKKFGMYKFRSMVVNAEKKLYQDGKFYN